MTEKLQINVAMQIQKPIHEVFDAIVDPSKMANYFISESTGRMESNKNLIWKFPEFELEFEIRVDCVEKDKFISYYWSNNNVETFVEIFLSVQDDNTTLVSISEKSRENDSEGLQWLSGNSFGWSNFLACLKAYLEFGINLRKGAFDYLKNTNHC
jgi:uncharacterized protein YndB with AHSA1/START domain